MHLDRRLVLLCLGLLLASSMAVAARPTRPTGPDRPAPTSERTPSRSGERNGSKPTAEQAQAARATLKGKMSPQQQQNVTQLQQDLAGLKAGSQVTQSQKDALGQSLTSLAQGTVKPSPESVSQLSSDLSKALADGNLSKQEQIQLSQDIAVVMNSANIPASEVQAVIADVEDILISSNVDKADAQKITSDLQAIATELQTNVP
jgi:hypothetical protein